MQNSFSFDLPNCKSRSSNRGNHEAGNTNLSHPSFKIDAAAQAQLLVNESVESNVHFVLTEDSSSQNFLVGFIVKMGKTKWLMLRVAPIFSYSNHLLDQTKNAKCEILHSTSLPRPRQ